MKNPEDAKTKEVDVIGYYVGDKGVVLLCFNPVTGILSERMAHKSVLVVTATE